MKYIKLDWPEIQDYMHHPDYQEECFYDASRNVWFIPENWEPENLGLGGDIGDLENTLG